MVADVHCEQRRAEDPMEAGHSAPTRDTGITPDPTKTRDSVSLGA
jgi:hypothetical protein